MHVIICLISAILSSRISSACKYLRLQGNKGQSHLIRWEGPLILNFEIEYAFVVVDAINQLIMVNYLKSMQHFDVYSIESFDFKSKGIDYLSYSFCFDLSCSSWCSCNYETENLLNIYGLNFLSFFVMIKNMPYCPASFILQLPFQKVVLKWVRDAPRVSLVSRWDKTQIPAPTLLHKV